MELTASPSDAVRGEVALPLLRCLRYTLVGLICSLVGALVYVVHEVAMVHDPGFHGVLDTVMHIAGTITKWGVLLVWPMAMYPHVVHAHRNRRRSALLFLMTVVPYALVAAAMLPLREYYVTIISDDVVRGYYMSPSSPLAGMGYEGLEEWRARWAAGIPQTMDALSFLMAAAGFAGAAFLWGRYLLGLAAGIAWFCAMLILLPAAMGIVVLDYDIFLGGLVSDSLCLDLFCFYVAIPSSILLFVILAAQYLLLLAAAWRLGWAGRGGFGWGTLLLWDRTAEKPEPPLVW